MQESKLKHMLLSMWDEMNYRVILHRVYRQSHINIMNVEDTVKYILEHHCSVARYGDGEFSIMLQYGAPGFQNSSAEMAHDLLNVFDHADSDNLLICFPGAMASMSGIRHDGRRFWTAWAMEHQLETLRLVYSRLSPNYVFGDTNISRPYSPYRSDRMAKKMFPLLQKLWDGRDILIVEGAQTRLGIGNDLFSNARSIKRILGPAENAYGHYEQILSSVRRHWNGELVILALGPAATILASDLSRIGIQALDLGHIDIQYEWFLAGSKTLEPVAGKYTNEAKDGGNEVAQCEDAQYLAQIIDQVD